MAGTAISEIHEVAEQGQDADDDDNDAHDLLSTAINRQHIDQIKDQENNANVMSALMRMSMQIPVMSLKESSFRSNS